MDVAMRAVRAVAALLGFCILVYLVASDRWWLALAASCWILACTCFELALPRH